MVTKKYSKESLKLMLLALFVGSALVGCSKKPASMAEEFVDLELEVQQIIQKADVYYAEGKTNDAVMLLEDAYAKEDYKFYTKSIIWALLNTYLQQQDIESAKKLYLDTLNNTPEIANSLFGSIEYTLKSAGNVEVLDDWCFGLVENPNANEDLKVQALWYLQEVYFENANWLKVSDIVMYANDNLKEPLKYKFLEASLRQVVAASQYAVVDKIVSTLKLSLPENDLELKNIILDAEFSSLIKQNKMDDAKKLYEQNFSWMNGRSKNNNFSVLLSEYNKEKNYLLADDLLVFVTRDISAEDPSYKLFMRAWVQQSKLEEKPAEVQVRVLDIINSDSTDKFKQSIISSFFYYLMENLQGEQKQALVESVKTLLMKSEDELVKESLASISLDGCFLLNDFDGAIEVVNTYEWPEDNKAMSKDKLLPKIKAHKALLNEDYPEAVKNFRVFMDVIKQQPDEKYMDPYTGQQISVESILGLNAVRVAELWEKAGDTEQAKIAYKEAAEYYNAALEKEKKDSVQYQTIQKKLKQLEGK